MDLPDISLSETESDGFENPPTASDAVVELVESTLELQLDSQVFPNEIMLAIMAQSSQSTLAIFTQVSSACLSLASPLLYRHVAISSTWQATHFFLPPTTSPSSLPPHLQPHFSRTQTKHLSILEPTDDGLSAFNPNHCYIDGDHPLPLSPLSLDSYSNPFQIGYFNRLINPSMVLLGVHPSRHRAPTLLAHVRSVSVLTGSRLTWQWSRLEDFVFRGFLPTLNEVPSILVPQGRFVRFTMDLSMIEQNVDPRNPKGSCQRLVEEFATLLVGARGRVWVGSRDMKERFEVAKEELVKRLEGKKLGKEIEKIPVEISQLQMCCH